MKTTRQIIEEVFGRLELRGRVFIGSDESNIKSAINKALSIQKEEFLKEIDEDIKKRSEGSKRFVHLQVPIVIALRNIKQKLEGGE